MMILARRSLLRFAICWFLLSCFHLIESVKRRLKSGTNVFNVGLFKHVKEEKYTGILIPVGKKLELSQKDEVHLIRSGDACVVCRKYVGNFRFFEA